MSLCGQTDETFGVMITGILVQHDQGEEVWMDGICRYLGGMVTAESFRAGSVVWIHVD